MKLIIARHGETEENKNGIVQGHLPGKLTPEGIEQAKKLALRLKNEQIDYIYSSDLARAKDTAKEIIKFHPNTPVKFVKELRERYLGEFQGKPSEELHRASNIDEMFLKSKNGETREDYYLRGKKFISKIIKQHIKDNVLLIAHGGINRAMFCAIVGKDEEEKIPKSLNEFKNTNVSIFEIDENGKHKVHLLNCTKHLEL